MTCFVARLKIKSGMEDEFLRLQRELSELSRRHEPDMATYDLIKSRDEPGLYVYYAHFKDEAAFQLHQTTPFHDRLIPGIMACVDGAMDLKFYDFVC
jgi:quinol monooxygenase YgiN